MHQLDPHQRPPECIRAVYKKYQKMKPRDLDQDEDIIDLPLHGDTSQPGSVRVLKQINTQATYNVFRAFGGVDLGGNLDNPPDSSSIPVFEHDNMPGLHIIPNLLPPEIQSILLSRLLHRDFSNPAHLTNIHTHYTMSYPPNDASFFSLSPSSLEAIAAPIDAAVHKPLNVSQLLNKKMRWSTLGGQYDWTEKRYPDSPPPAFPSDVKELLEGIFTSTKAEAAIVNLYSPGDTLSVHRDVAEASSTGLISISLGCDAIFIIGVPDPNSQMNDPNHMHVLTLRLRSGSAVYMSGNSRFAWHGVPQIVAGTCPDFLKNWPCSTEEPSLSYEEWRGWMAGKRVNLNVRQMWD